MRARTHLLHFQFLEIFRHVLKFNFRQHALGHREQHHILLVYVRMQQSGVLARCVSPAGATRFSADGIGLCRLAHFAHQRAALLVLVEHHAEGAAALGHPARFEQRVKDVLLLPVMALVSKDLKTILKTLEGVGRMPKRSSRFRRKEEGPDRKSRFNELGLIGLVAEIFKFPRGCVVAAAPDA